MKIIKFFIYQFFLASLPLNGTKDPIGPLQIGHGCLRSIRFFPQSLQTQKCPQGIMMTFFYSQRQT